MSKTVRIANGQGFWGDSIDAPVRLIEYGKIDYLTLDYLAEVTLSIMQKQKRKNPALGYATDFVDLMARTLPIIKAKGIRVIANGGGVNPEACRAAIRRGGVTDKEPTLSDIERALYRPDARIFELTPASNVTTVAGRHRRPKFRWTIAD